MTDLFLQNGHLSDSGLAALVSGKLNEMARLEAAEHLSFCDDCLVRYTSLLADDCLLTPATDQTLPVMRRLRQKAAKILFSRYTAAVAAVAIAGTLWYSGVMVDVAETFQEDWKNPPPQVQQVEPEVYTPPKERESKISEAVNNWFAQTIDTLTDRTNGEPAEPSAAPDAGSAATQTPNHHLKGPQAAKPDSEPDASPEPSK